MKHTTNAPARLIRAAEELNLVMDLKPKIDVKVDAHQLKDQIREAIKLVENGDEFTKETARTIKHYFHIVIPTCWWKMYDHLPNNEETFDKESLIEEVSKTKPRDFVDLFNEDITNDEDNPVQDIYPDTDNGLKPKKTRLRRQSKVIQKPDKQEDEPEQDSPNRVRPIPTTEIPYTEWRDSPLNPAYHLKEHRKMFPDDK